MYLLLDLLLVLITYVISCTSRYLLWPLIKFASWYLLYFVGSVFLNVLYKLRYEVYNEDLKLGEAECNRRAVLVTGATSGIGLAATRHLSKRGFVVIACYYSHEEPGYNELKNSSNFNSGVKKSVYLVKLDVRSTDSIEECYEQVKLILSENPQLQLHAILNVAGVGYFYKFQWFTREMIKKMVETNLMGAMMITRQFLHLLVKGSDGRVVNVASPLAVLPIEYNSVYCATKSGLTQFTNTLEIDLLPYNIKTCTIHPGNLIRNTSVIDSSLSAKLDMVMTELNEEERDLYKKDLDNHLLYMEKVERAFNKPGYMQSSKKSILSIIRWFMLINSGALPLTRLDENDAFVQSFDNALRLRNPPKEMFAGNMYFNLVSSSGLEQVSRALCRDIVLLLQRKRTSFVI